MIYTNRLKALFTTNKLSYLLSVYFTVALVSMVTSSLNTQFLFDSKFAIGEATAEGVDISSRIRIFYWSSFLGLSVLLISFGILSKLLNDFMSNIKRNQELSVLMVMQLCLFAISFFLDSRSYANELLNASIVMLLVFELLEYKGILKLNFFKAEFILSSFLAFVGLFVLVENVYIATTAILLLVVLYNVLSAPQWFRSLLVVLSAMPLLFVFVVELSFVMRHWGLDSWGYIYSLVVVMVCFVLIAWLRRLTTKTFNTILYSWQAPLLLVGIAAFNIYEPVITQFTELFEYANTMNPVMMSELHGGTLFLNQVPSHLLSDYFWEKIYVYLYGFDGSTSPVIYHPIGYVLQVLCIYLFLQEVLRKQFGLVFFMLFLPFAFTIIPTTYAFALLPAIALNRFFKNKEMKYLWWFAVLSTLLLFWRLDIGIAVVSSSLVLFLLLFVFEKGIRKSMLIILGTLGLFYGAVFYFYWINYPEVITQLLHYFGGSQAHGLSLLTRVESNLYFFDYFVFPGVLIIVLFVLLSKIKGLKEKGLFWLILFVTGFYFFNFQRGLVRHSFAENNEVFVNSFAWLSILLTVVLVRKKPLGVSFFVLTILIGLFLSIRPMHSRMSLMDSQKSISVNELPDLNLDSRILSNPDFETYTRPVIDFLKSNLTEDETFLDFTNAPMLYYYTQKRVPSIFSQSLQNLVDEYLQDKNIEGLSDFKVPFVVFNRSINVFGDNTDGIPNRVRYHKIACYIYENYVPYNEYGLFRVWIHKDRVKDHVPNFHLKSEHWPLKWIPYFWSKEFPKGKAPLNANVSHQADVIRIDSLKANEFLKLDITSANDGTVMLRQIEKDVEVFKSSFSTKKGTHHYYIPISSSYQLYRSKDKSLEVSKSRGVSIIGVNLVGK